MGALDDSVIGDIRFLLEGLPGQADDAEGARFWKTLAAKHIALLREHGFGNFKRTINFEYSQWGVVSFLDPRTRRLLRTLLRGGTLPVGGLLARYDLSDRGVVRWPDGIDLRTGEAVAWASAESPRRFRAYAFYCGLLWQCARKADALGVLDKVKEPSLGNPLPVRYRGRFISQDLALGSLELNRIHRHHPLGRVRRVLEIGAGYGRLAYLFRVLFPDVEYSIVDIPPALAISRRYLEAEFGPEDVAVDFWGRAEGLPTAPIRLHTPDALDRFPDARFDLIINISSFDEMDPETVARYFRAIDRVGAGALYLKGYSPSRSPGRLGVEAFPRDPAWTVAYLGEDPVVPGFVEAVWKRD
jgi:SAM-dependent methyltransferase